MSALIARLAPWSLIALAVAGVVIWGLWGRLAKTSNSLWPSKAPSKQPR